MLAVLLALLVSEPSPKPEPRPSPTPVLEGRVHGPDGKPIAGALVVARSSLAWTEPPLSTKTDTSGAFRLPLKNGGTHDVWAQAAGLAVATREDVRPGSQLVIRLAAGGSIEGVVRDASSGAPVAGARVETEPNDRAPAWVPGAGSVATTTDRNGRFRLEGLDRRPQTVVASARGHGRAQQQGVVAGRRVELFLLPGASVSGVVVDAEGRPVGDAVVRLESQQRMRWAPAPRTTDASGRFAFDGLPAGNFALVARHPELGLAVSPGVEVGAEADVRRDVILLPGVPVTGRLVDSEEQPVPGRLVVGELFGEPAPRSVADALSADAGPDGRFRIEGVPLGFHTLAVSAPGFAPRRVEFEARPAPPPSDLGDVTMESGLRLRGQVRSRAGVPIPEARLHASQRPGMSPVTAQATSDANGVFVIGGLQAGLVRLHVRASGFAPYSTSTEAGASDLDVVLDDAGSIGGVVVDERGAAVPSFRVSASQGDYQTQVFDEFNDTEGRFLLESVGQGSWTLSVMATGCAEASVTDVVVRPGRASDVGRIRLKRGATIRGQVVSVDDTPVVGATVRAVPSGPRMMHWGNEPTASSDASGLFELTGVPPGTTDVIAGHPGYAEQRVRDIEVDAARPAEVRLVLGRGGRIEGTARRRDGGSLAGAFVHAIASGSGGYFSFENRRPVAPDGGFAIEHVPAGTVRVNLLVASGGGGFSTAVASSEVEVREGETAVLELLLSSILVTGHVTRAGAPVAGARVNLRTHSSASYTISEGGVATPPVPTGGPQRGTAVTDEEGRYQLIVDSPGAAFAFVETSDPPGRQSFPNLDIPDADTFTLDLALGSTTLTGIVVNGETGSPVPDVFVSAHPKEGPGTRVWSQTGADGRFRLEVEPGDYALSAQREGYAPARMEVASGSAGLAEIVLTLEQGEQIRGRVVDARGNGVSGVYVTARGGDDAQGAETLADGHFRISGLKAGSYTLWASASGFARAQVTAPAEGVLLQLAPGGRVSVRVLAQDGSPARAVVQVDAVDGQPVSPDDADETDAQGVAEIAAPAGTVTLRAWSQAATRALGRATVTVAEGQTVSAEIVLAPPEQAER